MDILERKTDPVKKEFFEIIKRKEPRVYEGLEVEPVSRKQSRIQVNERAAGNTELHLSAGNLSL